MRYILDLHIHSRYARACSQQLTLPNIDMACVLKGVHIIGTGDFCHPQWFHEMKSHLEPAEQGLYKLKGSSSGTRFMCTNEISCIYSKDGKVRRLHILVLAPSLEVVEKINSDLGKIGNLASDGRPILGLDAKKLAEIIFSVDKSCMVIPAHAWTPWFAVFGSHSGFDSLEECFEELTQYIYAIETGLSSDPPMNWRLSALDNLALVSHSDAHSLPNIGREANVFEIDKSNISYNEISRIIKEKDKEKFLYTIEFYPEEGMYHWDGHRKCEFSAPPSVSSKHKNICPKCNKSLTLGVLNRVEELSDKLEGRRPESAYGYLKLVGLDKIIAEAFMVKNRQSKKVQQHLQYLVSRGKSELDILIDMPIDQLKSITMREIAEGIIRMRKGKLTIEPGFDGRYGKVNIFKKEELTGAQPALF